MDEQQSPQDSQPTQKPVKVKMSFKMNGVPIESPAASPQLPAQPLRMFTPEPPKDKVWARVEAKEGTLWEVMKVIRKKMKAFVEAEAMPLFEKHGWKYVYSDGECATVAEVLESAVDCLVRCERRAQAEGRARYEKGRMMCQVSHGPGDRDPKINDSWYALLAVYCEEK